jgi:5-methyltetrahydropteroyltriglutamate--homocysteine methyltransferase
MSVKIAAHGYPKMGRNREVKKSLEAYWKGQIQRDTLLKETDAINNARLLSQKKAGMDFIPSNDFSLYDSMLDHSLMFNVIPKRFKNIKDDRGMRND